jgi:hypothetical protein
MSVSGDVVNIPDPDRLVHLQFPPFRGLSGLRLAPSVHGASTRRDRGSQAFARSLSSIQRWSLRRYEHDLPFAVIADPNKRLYVEFGVERSPRALLDPRVWIRIMRAVLADSGTSSVVADQSRPLGSRWVAWITRRFPRDQRWSCARLQARRPRCGPMVGR